MRVSATVAAMQAHKPAIALRPGPEAVLNLLRDNELGSATVSDVRGVIQQAKLAAPDWLDADFISISEEVGCTKADIERFLPMERRLPAMGYCYAADIKPKISTRLVYGYARGRREPYRSSIRSFHEALCAKCHYKVVK